MCKKLGSIDSPAEARGRAQWLRTDNTNGGKRLSTKTETWRITSGDTLTKVPCFRNYNVISRSLVHKTHYMEVKVPSLEGFWR